MQLGNYTGYEPNLRSYYDTLYITSALFSYCLLSYCLYLVVTKQRKRLAIYFLLYTSTIVTIILTSLLVHIFSQQHKIM
jgi:hypothetical protein